MIVSDAAKKHDSGQPSLCFSQDDYDLTPSIASNKLLRSNLASEAGRLRRAHDQSRRSASLACGLRPLRLKAAICAATDRSAAGRRSCGSWPTTRPIRADLLGHRPLRSIRSITAPAAARSDALRPADLGAFPARRSHWTRLFEQKEDLSVCSPRGEGAKNNRRMSQP